MTPNKGNKPEPRSIIDGPSLRELELALTDPVPMAESQANREVCFKAISWHWSTEVLRAGIWMMRKVGPPQWQVRNPTEWELGLLVTATQFKTVASDLFSIQAQQHGFQLAYEMLVRYDTQTRRGEIIVTEE